MEALLTKRWKTTWNPMAGRPPVPIPSSSSSRSTSRVEHVLASFEEPARSRFGRLSSDSRRQSLGPITSSMATPPSGATANSVGTSALPSSYGASSSPFQPRVVRASSTHESNTLATRHSLSPTRHRRQSAHIPVPPRPPTKARVQSVPGSRTAPFVPPSYLSNAVLGSLMHGGPIPLQAHVPEPRVIHQAEPRSTMSDSDDDSTHVGPVHSRRHPRAPSPRETTSWPTQLAIPTKWSETDKSSHLTISANGKDVSFHGKSSSCRIFLF